MSRIYRAKFRDAMIWKGLYVQIMPSMEYRLERQCLGGGLGRAGLETTGALRLQGSRFGSVGRFDL